MGLREATLSTAPVNEWLQVTRPEDSRGLSFALKYREPLSSFAVESKDVRDLGIAKLSFLMAGIGFGYRIDAPEIHFRRGEKFLLLGRQNQRVDMVTPQYTSQFLNVYGDEGGRALLFVCKSTDWINIKKM